MLFHKLSATVFGIGYIGKGAGTVAAITACICWYLVFYGNYYSPVYSVVITVIIIALGVWSGNKVEPIWGKDHDWVVIDEVAGMCITLLFIPVTIKFILAGLVLFRFFDIVKPFFIKKSESLPGGWGVMIDDILAGIYSNILLQVFVVLHLFRT